MAPLFDNICTLPLSSDLFAQAIHPTLPLLSIGLSSGHVQTYRLPPTNDPSADSSTGSDLNSEYDDITKPQRKRVKISETIIRGPTPNGNNSSAADSAPHPILSQSTHRRSSAASESGLGSIDSIWSTRRHKGSCRTLAFSHDGASCYSAGTDGLVKCFDTETGRVTSKFAIPDVRDYSEDIDSPSLLHVLSPQGLLLATDSGRLYYHDIRQGGKEADGRAAQTWRPHGEEHVNALVPLPPGEASTSGFPKSWVSVGGTTLAVTDMRKGVVSTSEDQEVELTSVCFISGLKKGGTSVGEKICVGQSDGVVSLWERGVWGDLDERVVIDRMGTAVDSVVEVPAAEFGYGRGLLKMNEKIIACGLEDGRVRFMRIGRNAVLHDWDIKHDEIDGAVGLGFDIGGRMVSGGGNIVKVWTEAKGVPGGGKHADNNDNHTKQNPDESDNDSDDNAWEDAASDSSEEESGSRDKQRKKRKRNKGKDKTGGKAFDFTM